MNTVHPPLNITKALALRSSILNHRCEFANCPAEQVPLWQILFATSPTPKFLVFPQKK